MPLRKEKHDGAYWLISALVKFPIAVFDYCVELLELRSCGARSEDVHYVRVDCGKGSQI